MVRRTKLTHTQKKERGAFDGYIVSVQSVAVVSSPRDKLNNDQKENVTSSYEQDEFSFV